MTQPNCPKCGNTNLQTTDRDRLYCDSCGHEFSVDEKPPGTEPPGQDPLWKITKTTRPK